MELEENYENQNNLTFIHQYMTFMSGFILLSKPAERMLRGIKRKVFKVVEKLGL